MLAEKLTDFHKGFSFHSLKSVKGQHRLTVQLGLGASGQDYPAEKRRGQKARVNPTEAQGT